MIETPRIAEDLARGLVSERAGRSSTRRVPPLPRRHRVTSRLRRVADRLES